MDKSPQLRSVISPSSRLLQPNAAQIHRQWHTKEELREVAEKQVVIEHVQVRRSTKYSKVPSRLFSPTTASIHSRFRGNLTSSDDSIVVINGELSSSMRVQSAKAPKTEALIAEPLINNEPRKKQKKVSAASNLLKPTTSTTSSQWHMFIEASSPNKTKSSQSISPLQNSSSNLLKPTASTTSSRWQAPVLAASPTKKVLFILSYNSIFSCITYKLLFI